MHRLVFPRFLTAGIAVIAGTMTLGAQDTTSTIRYKAVTLSPVFAAVGDVIWRSRNLESDIGSPYQNIPFNNTTNAKTTEFRGTGRHSRMGFFAEAPTQGDTITAMWEVDFLASGTTSKSDENNGYGVRLRQGWVFYNMPSHFSIGAGQMWSLLTTNKKGIVPRSEQIPTTIDAQYAVGYDWARQAGLRLTKSGKVVSAAISIEGAQTTFSSRNVPADVVLGQPGGSALNVLQNYSTDVSPDFIGKIAFDPAGWGHWEIKALGRVLRDRIVDPANVDGGSRSLTSMGGGAGFGVYYPVMSKDRDILDVAVSGLAGKGIGRYGTSQLVDATVKSGGGLEPIKAGHVVLGLEAHPTRKLDVYTYEGVEYNDRTAYVDGAGRGVGYGSPLNNNVGCEVEATPTGPYGPTSGTCNADNRSIWQANLGFWYRIRRSAAGTLQWGMQVSHTVRQTWAGVAGEPVGQENMFFSSFRYLLP